MSKIKSISISALIILPMATVVYLLMKLPSDSAGEVVAISPADLYVAEDTRSDSPDERIDSLEQKVNGIGERQNAILGRLQELISLARATKTDSADGMPDNKSSDQLEHSQSLTQKTYSSQDLEAITEKENAIFAAKESEFYNEGVDDSWQANEERKLSSILSQEGLNKATVNSLECRQSSCRADISHANDDKASEFLDNLLQSLPNSEGQFKLEKQSDGSMKTVLLIKPPRE